MATATRVVTAGAKKAVRKSAGKRVSRELIISAAASETTTVSGPPTSTK